MLSLVMAIGVTASVHEFSWQLFPWELQGHWRGFTQWLPMLALCFSAARLGHNEALSATCLAVAIMSSTTALCSAGWLVFRWETGPTGTSCTKALTGPVLMLSVIVAALCLLRWTK